jgi:hypothetical protein
MGEASRVASAIVLKAALLAGCIAVPLVLARRVHPGIGCTLALAASFLWVRLVRPMPGYLQGIFSVTGLAVLLAAALACLALWLNRPAARLIGKQTRPNTTLLTATMLYSVDGSANLGCSAEGGNRDPFTRGTKP